jgi:hypothetical protein
MADQKTDSKAKVTTPQRCAEKVKKAQLRPDVSISNVLGQSKTLELGKNPVYGDCFISEMAIHPHGLYVSITMKGETKNIIVPSVNFSYYELMDE